MEGDTVADVRGDAARQGDTYLLCSDGLWGSLADETLAELMGASAIADGCRALVEAALFAGSSDNITAVLVRVSVSDGESGHSGTSP